MSEATIIELPKPLGLEPGLHYNIDERYYYRDLLCDVPTLSRGELLVMIDECPMNCRHAHPRLGAAGAGSDANADMDFGSMSHKLVLGRGADIEIIEAQDYKTNAAKAARDGARDRGHIPALRHQYDLAQRVARAFDSELHRLGLAEMFYAGESEVVAIWQDTTHTRGRALLDKLYIDKERGRAVIFDPKFSKQVSLRELGRHIDNQKYHVQERWYKRAVTMACPEVQGRVDFIYLFMSVDLTRPLQMVPVRLAGEFSAIAESKITRGVMAWDRCMSSGNWPGYTDTVLNIEPPEYALAKEMSES
jgi:hypothetical protein